MKKQLLITIFGSTGDLTARKLLPALNQLIKNKEMTTDVLILAIGRRDFSNEAYFEFVKSIYNTNLDYVKPFVKYYNMEITNEDHYLDLNKEINLYKGEHSRHLVYLALAPELMVGVSSYISKHNIVKYNELNSSVVFEKPFGHDLDSARDLNQNLSKFFTEDQMYRIDHYLGKEMIQNLLYTRNYNTILSSVWNRKHIKSVSIYLKENRGILNRASYYDEVGALRDMMQSHLLQVVSLIAMHEPKSFHSKDIKEEKVKALRALTFDPKSVFMGQYIGYLNEKGVKESSNTETFVAVKAFVNNDLFADVPFYLITGKKLAKKESYIEIIFNHTKIQKKLSPNSSENRLRISIDPIDGFTLTLNSKKFGLIDDTEALSLTFHQTDEAITDKVEAYEKLLFDAINNHKTLFTSWDEISASWEFTDQLKAVKRKLIHYHDETYLLNYLKGCGLYEDL